MENTFKVKLSTLSNMNDFIKVCNLFDEDIDYKIGSYIIDAKSVMGVMSTSINKEAYVTIYTDNSRVVDSFVDNIKNWIIGDF